MLEPAGNDTGSRSAIATPGPGRTDAVRVRILLEGAVENLMGTWDHDRGRFPFSSRLIGSTIVNDYAHPVAVRYTINSLLGLAAAARAGTLDVTEAQVHAMVDRFLARTPERLLMPADHGLLALLECELSSGLAIVRDRTRAMARLLQHAASGSNMQDVAWLLWGSAAVYRAGVGVGAELVRDALEIIVGRLVDPGTGLPRHAAARYRRNVVSFGSLVYFLRAMREASETLGDERAQALFEGGVSSAISFQGPQGEWPWMIDCRVGRPFDSYPVFAVHQDSMAMLFLHPALDQGLPNVATAITRSLAWDFGENELGAKMFTERPFFAYRSIERAERAPRVRRYVRSLGSRTGVAHEPRYVRRTRINDECRSYNLGWILFVWSSRPEASDQEDAEPEQVGLST